MQVTMRILKISLHYRQTNMKQTYNTNFVVAYKPMKRMEQKCYHVVFFKKGDTDLLLNNQLQFSRIISYHEPCCPKT